MISILSLSSRIKIPFIPAVTFMKAGKYLHFGTISKCSIPAKDCDKNNFQKIRKISSKEVFQILAR